jgi:hypothetical protein
MAFVTKGRGDLWELRQSRHTPNGPRSITLASFDELTPRVVEHALARAVKPLTAADVERAALRAGAPVRQPAADRAARELLGELARGARPRASLRRLLAAGLGDAAGGAGVEPPSDAARAAGEWAGAALRDRAEALVDLLLLADALPPPRRGREPRFPRLDPATG